MKWIKTRDGYLVNLNAVSCIYFEEDKMLKEKDKMIFYCVMHIVGDTVDSEPTREKSSRTPLVGMNALTEFLKNEDTIFEL